MGRARGVAFVALLLLAGCGSGGEQVVGAADGSSATTSAPVTSSSTTTMSTSSTPATAASVPASTTTTQPTVVSLSTWDLAESPPQPADTSVAVLVYFTDCPTGPDRVARLDVEETDDVIEIAAHVSGPAPASFDCGGDLRSDVARVTLARPVGERRLRDRWCVEHPDDQRWCAGPQPGP